MKTFFIFLLFLISIKLYSEDPCDYPCPEASWNTDYRYEDDYLGCEDCDILVQWKWRITTCEGITRFEYRLTGLNWTTECLKEHNPDNFCFETYDELFNSLFFYGYTLSGLPLPNQNDSCISFIRAYLDACWVSEFNPTGQIQPRPCKVTDCCIHNYTICLTPNGYQFTAETPAYSGDCIEPFIPCYQMCDGLTSYEMIPYYSLTMLKQKNNSQYNKINIDDVGFEISKELTIKIYTYNAILVKTIKVQNNKKFIDLSSKGLKHGVYLYDIVYKGKIITKGSVLISE